MNESLLDQVIFPHPFPALIAVLMVGGMFYLGKMLSFIFFPPIPRAIEVVASYVIVVILVGFCADFYLHGLIPLIALKSLGVLFLISGILFFNYLYKFLVSTDELRGMWNKGFREYQLPVIIVLVILFALFLSSLAPPTDADSLDYHLGVPLAWLDYGGFSPLYNWYHARLTGLGERIILFGLANGTDVFSSLIQWSGLLVAITALSSFSRSNESEDVLLASLLVVSAPVILFLVLNQKPYLFPASSIILAAAIYFSEKDKVNTDLLIVGFILVASWLFKYTFLLSTFGLLIILLYDSLGTKRLTKLFLIFLMFFLLLVVPYYLRNYLYFGDPISPLLSQFLPNMDPTLVDFTKSVKVESSFSLSNLVKIPFTQGIVTMSPGLVTTIIGFGGIAILGATLSTNKKSKFLMAAFYISFCVIVLLGRPISRLMFDVYLFGGAALILSDFIRYKGMTIKVLSLQAIGVLLLSLYSVYALSPGIISDESRDQVLFDNASGYSASRELNKLLPPNSVLLTDIRSKSLLPGKVILADAFQYATSVDDVNRIVLSENISNHITHVALKAMDRDIYSSIFECANKDTKRIIKVSRATRNPFNESSYSFVFFEINRDKKCFLNNA